MARRPAAPRRHQGGRHGDAVDQGTSCPRPFGRSAPHFTATARKDTVPIAGRPPKLRHKCGPQAMAGLPAGHRSRARSTSPRDQPLRQEDQHPTRMAPWMISLKCERSIHSGSQSAARRPNRLPTRAEPPTTTIVDEIDRSEDTEGLRSGRKPEAWQIVPRQGREGRRQDEDLDLCGGGVRLRRRPAATCRRPPPPGAADAAAHQVEGQTEEEAAPPPRQ